ncbi:MAG: hypothetical protein JWM30_3180 [Burkholderia sp.]|nr:hypothetical protein [Burkholderia sp.]
MQTDDNDWQFRCAELRFIGNLMVKPAGIKAVDCTQVIFACLLGVMLFGYSTAQSFQCLSQYGHRRLATSIGNSHAVFPGNRDQFWNVEGAHRDFLVERSEKMRGLAVLAGDRDHFATACAKAEAMDRTCG